MHAGFHKTATTTVQRTLRENGDLLRPKIILALRPKLVEIISAARGYSTWRDPASLMRYGHRVARFLGDVPLGPRRCLCLSAEELAGHMPGRDHVPDFAHVPDLMREFADMAEQVFGARLDLVFFFSTRDPQAWLRSAWAEHVKASRMTLDLADFLVRYADLNPDATLDAIRARVAPHRVITSRLEDCADLPLGPAQPLFDLLPLAPEVRAALKPAPTANQSLPAEVLQQFLRLNRSDCSADELATAKKAILAAAELG